MSHIAILYGSGSMGIGGENFSVARDIAVTWTPTPPRPHALPGPRDRDKIFHRTKKLQTSPPKIKRCSAYTYIYKRDYS